MKTMAWIGMGAAAGLLAFACGGDDSTGNVPLPDSGGAPDTSNNNADSGSNPDTSTPTDSGNNDSSMADAAAFDPGTVPGLVLWLDAAKNVTQTMNNVSAWGDQTTHKNNAAQGNANRQPTLVASGINGLPTVHFAKGAAQGIGEMLTIANNADHSLEWGTGDFYIAVVARFDNDPADNANRGVGLFYSKFGGGSVASGVFFSGNIPNGAMPTSTASLGAMFLTSMTPGDSVSVATKYNDGMPRIFVVARTGKQLDMAVNGVAAGTAASSGNDVSNATAAVRIGADVDATMYRLNGDISEMLAVKGALSLSDRAGILGYLKAKYAL